MPIEQLAEEAGGVDVEAGCSRSSPATGTRSAVERRVVLDGYRLVDIAFKVVGVGSVGTRAWIALMLGRDSATRCSCRSRRRSARCWSRTPAPSEFDHQGERVVHGQRLMQAASDVLLGWVRAEGIDGERRDFYVRQLWDWKGSARIESMDARGLTAYAEICGMTLAHAHARGGDRIAIAAYLGKSDIFDLAMADFAEAYADQSERDYEALRAAVADGRVKARALGGSSETPARV